MGKNIETTKLKRAANNMRLVAICLEDRDKFLENLFLALDGLEPHPIESSQGVINEVLKSIEKELYG